MSASGCGALGTSRRILRIDFSDFLYPMESCIVTSISNAFAFSIGACSNSSTTFS